MNPLPPNWKDSPWINQAKDIPLASIDSLKKSLLTCDGCGTVFKEQALEELIRRVRE